MPCTGTCQIEQHEWREDRIEHNPYNGAPYGKPGAAEEEVAARTSDATIWSGEDLSTYTELVIFLLIDFSAQWTAGVDRQYPRHGRALNCTEEGCICDYDRDKPTVVEDWPKTMDPVRNPRALRVAAAQGRRPDQGDRPEVSAQGRHPASQAGHSRLVQGQSTAPCSPAFRIPTRRRRLAATRRQWTT